MITLAHHRDRLDLEESVDEKVLQDLQVSVERMAKWVHQVRRAQPEDRGHPVFPELPE